MSLPPPPFYCKAYIWSFTSTEGDVTYHILSDASPTMIGGQTEELVGVEVGRSFDEAYKIAQARYAHLFKK